MHLHLVYCWKDSGSCMLKRLFPSTRWRGKPLRKQIWDGWHDICCTSTTGKCQEQHCDFDLTKTVDTVSIAGLWKVIENFGCPSKSVTLVCQFFDGMLVKLLDDVDQSEAFSVTNSVKCGCVLAPTLYSMLNDAFKDCGNGIPIPAPIGWRAIPSPTPAGCHKGERHSSGAFLFADDCTLSVSTKQMVQQEMDCFLRTCDNIDLTINTKKP